MKIDRYLDRTRKGAPTQEDFARRLGVSQGLVWQWINGRTRITAERAIQIEAATAGEVTRHDLRPDVFGDPPPAKKEAAA